MTNCEICREPSAFSCSVCQASHFCSVECQKLAWRNHEHVCKTFKDFAVPPTPTDSCDGHIRAIYFPQDEEKPRWVWLPYSKIGGAVVTQLGGFLGITEKEKEEGKCEAMGWEDVNHVIGLGRYMDHIVRMHYRNGVNAKGSTHALNPSIAKASDTRLNFQFAWKGPVIAYGIKTFSYDLARITSTVDLQPGDMREIMTWFHTYFTAQASRQEPNPFLMMQVHLTDREMVQCVRVNCDGDVSVNGRKRFEAVELPYSHSIFKQTPPVPMSRIGFSFVLVRVPGSVGMWVGKEGGRAPVGWNGNSAAAFLSGPEEDLAIPFGSVLVANVGRSAVALETVAALAAFIGSVLYRFRIATNQQEGYAILGTVTKEGFEEYERTWRADPNRWEQFPVLIR